MNTLSAAWVLFQKELRIELRKREVTLSTTLFASLVTVIASLSFYVDDYTSTKLAPGVLWISIAFAGILAMGRSWARERENGVFRGMMLTPVPRAAVYLGKAAATLVFMLVVEIVLVVLVGLFFQVEASNITGPFLAILTLGTLGFVATGTLFSAMTVQTRARDLMLSVALFPLIAPALLGSVVATRELFSGAPLSELMHWVYILGAYDLIALFLGTVLFESLISE